MTGYNMAGYNVDLPFTRQVSTEELDEIVNDSIRLVEFEEKNKTSPMSVCSRTFQPYKVIDGLRYNIEDIMDIKARGF